MKYSPKFVKATNWQSRTAMVIMPPFFAFVAGAEHNLVHNMQKMASTAEHTKQMADWSQQHELDEHRKHLQRMTTQKILGLPGMTADGDISKRSDADFENRIQAKFRESVVNSGVRVVPGESLGFHHKIANFWQEKPIWDKAPLTIWAGSKSSLAASSPWALAFINYGPSTAKLPRIRQRRMRCPRESNVRLRLAM